MPAKGSALKGALAKSPKGGGRVTALPVRPPPMPLGKPNSAAGMAAGVAQGAAGLQRLSPGVYRNAQGNLVGNKGQALPGQRPQPQPQRPAMRPPMAPAASAVQGIAQGVGASFGGQMPASPQNNPALGAAQGAAQQFQPAAPFGGQQQQPSWRPPASYGQGMQEGMVYQGGSANFDETTGQYRNGFNPGSKPDFMSGQMPQKFPAGGAELQPAQPGQGFDQNQLNMLMQKQQQQGFGMANRMFQLGMGPQPIQRQMEPVQLATTEAEWQQRFNPYKG